MMGRWGGIPAGLAVLAWVNVGCVGYAYRSGADSYRPPAELAAAAAAAEGRPVVMLVTGSMIVAEFFDVMRDRLEERGYEALVFQSEGLFSETLTEGAAEVGAAIQTVVDARGGAPIKIIAECDGGIATRYYLQQLGGHANVERFVSFVSAHNGTTGFPVAYFPALADIKPDSEFMTVHTAGQLPAGATTQMYSVYVCEDEVMIPHTTSAFPGALNIEICDEAFAQRARERVPYKVSHGLGQWMIPQYDQHFGVFWDEAAFELLVSCLEDDEATIRAFDGLEVRVSE
jgi:triacylglycerol lipase